MPWLSRSLSVVLPVCVSSGAVAVSELISMREAELLSAA